MNTTTRQTKKRLATPIEQARICPMCGEKQVLIWNKGFNCENKCYEKWINEKKAVDRGVTS